MNTVNPNITAHREETLQERFKRMRIAHERLISEVNYLRLNNRRQKNEIAELRAKVRVIEIKEPNNHFNLALSILKEYYPYMTIYKLKSPSRERDLVVPRQMFYYMMRNCTEYSFKVIGKMCGGRDHSSVLHGCGVVTDVISYDKDYAFKITQACSRFKLALSKNGI